MTAQAEIKIKADPSQLPTGLRRALKMIQGFVHQTTGLMNPKKSKDPDAPSLALGSAIGGVASQLAMRGIDLLVSQTKQVFDFNKELIRFGIDIRKMPGDMEAIGNGIREVSNQTGLGALEVLKAGRAYVDLAGAESFTMDKMSLIARAAQASGADVREMAELMFTLTENMKVPPNELEDTIGGLVNQAKDGSIHFKELAHELVALGPVYKQFGVSGREGSIQLGAMMQIARRGFGSAGEAATGVLRILRSIPQHASKFKAAGVDVFTPGSKTNLEKFEVIIERIKKSKLSLDRQALIKAFGRTEGERFYQLLKDSVDQYDKLKEAGRENGTINKDLATYTESTAGRIDIAVEKMKNAFAGVLTPERVEQIVGGIERIAQAMPSIMHAIGRVSDAFGAFVHAVARTKQALTPDEGNEAITQDWQVNAGLADDQLNEYGKKIRKRARDRQAFNEAMKNITGEEDDFGPTDASVKKAILAAKSDMGLNAPTTQAGAAGRAYLAGRDDQITKSRYKRIEAEVDAEEKARAAVFGFNPTEKAEMKLAQESVRRIALEIANAIRGNQPAVHIDGNPVATAGDNARNRRRR